MSIIQIALGVFLGLLFWDLLVGILKAIIRLLEKKSEEMNREVEEHLTEAWKGICKGEEDLTRKINDIEKEKMSIGFRYVSKEEGS